MMLPIQANFPAIEKALGRHKPRAGLRIVGRRGDPPCAPRSFAMRAGFAREIPFPFGFPCICIRTNIW